MRPVLVSTGILVVASLVAADARAGDPPPPKDLDAEVDRAHALVVRERWGDAVAALRRIFNDFENDSRVRGRLREIEDDLKLSLFRKSQGPLKGGDLLGPAVVRFSSSLRDVELLYRDHSDPRWEVTENGTLFLGLRFEGSITIEADIDYLDRERRTAAVLVCYDVEKRGGYVATPGYFRLTGQGGYDSAPAGVTKVTAARRVELRNKASASASADANYDSPLVVTRTGSDIVVSVGSKVVAKASDSDFKTGYVGVSTTFRSFRIKGRLARHEYRRIVGEYYDDRYSTWQATDWKRDQEIPSWAGETPIVIPDATLFEVPGDTLRADRDAVSGTAIQAADGDLGAIVLAAARAERAPPDTRLYLSAAASLGVGAFKAAAEALDKLIAAEPDFAPARLLRGRAFAGLRRTDDCLADLRWLTKARPTCGEAWAEIAKVEMFRGDLDAASAALVEAAGLGAGGEELGLVLDWVHRARRGPEFAQRFEATTAHFVVASDHSQKVCIDTAALLESMQAKYAAAIGPAPAREGKSRVYVFSGVEGYMDYADDLLVPADQTAGVYLPMLQELVLWIPTDMTSFTDTVRHEGFHQFVHRLADRVPTWFNEGWAQVMGGGGPEGIRDAERDGEFVAQFVPVKELVGLDHAAFMVNADVTYTESRYLVDFLKGTSHPKLKTVLKDYMAAIVAGLSQEEANAKVLAPVADVLEAAFRASLKR